MKTSIFLLLFTLSTAVFSQETVTYEYVSIVQSGVHIYETKSGEQENFETINFKNEFGREYMNFTPFFKRIEKYEKEGYEVFSNILGGEYGKENYVLMRRKKTNFGQLFLVTPCSSFFAIF